MANEQAQHEETGNADRFDGSVEGKFFVHRGVVETSEYNFAVIGAAAHEITISINGDCIDFHGVRIEILSLSAVVQV